MEARYKSRCPLCKSKIYPGDRIMVNPGSRAAHAECPAPRDAAAPPSPDGGDGGYRFEDYEEFGEQPPAVRQEGARL
jgi:hypothetical protein